MDFFIMKEPLLKDINRPAPMGTISAQWPYSSYQFRDVRLDYKNIFLAVSMRWSHRSPSDHNLRLPIHHLPIEILGQIFEQFLRISINDHGHTLDDSTTTEWKPLPSISTDRRLGTSPMSLGQVCGYWRDIALSMPTLWSSICISCPQEHKRVLPTLNLWLDRSGACPLTLNLLSPSRDADNDGVLEDVLKLLILHVHRWKQVDFVIGNKEVSQSLVRLPTSTTKILESARLDIRGWDHDSVDRLWRSFHSCLSLHEVYWDSEYTRDNLPNHAPWGQFTSINIRRCSFEAVLEALHSCTAIITLTLTSIHEPQMLVERSAPLILPCLTTLIVGHSFPNSFFDCITLPALTTLEITFIYALTPSSTEGVCNFLARSSCNLKNLSLSDIWTDEDQLVKFLELPSLASVTTLRIIGLELTDKIISLLVYRVTDDKVESLFPNLEDMYIRGCCTTPGLLSDMVLSRIPLSYVRHGKTRRRLKRVEIGVREGFEHDISFLKTIKEDGLIILASL